MSLTANELAAKIHARVQGDGSRSISRFAPIEEADEHAVCFLDHRRYSKWLKKTGAGAVIVSSDAAEKSEHPCLLVSDHPRVSMQEAILLLHGERIHPFAGVSKHAIISSEATLGKDCSVHAFTVIERGAKLGDRCVIYPHCYIGENATIGDDCILFPSVCVYDECVLRDRVVLHAGTVIGQDGFGYASDHRGHHKIRHLSNAIIEDDVELGALCAIDRGALKPTRVGAGTKMSNQVAIGHGTEVGKHNLIVAQCGIAGSAVTGDFVVLGGQVGVVGHVKIGDRSQIAAKSGVVTSVPPDSKYAWFTAIPYDEAVRVGWEVIHLPDLVDAFNSLKKKVETLEAERGQ